MLADLARSLFRNPWHDHHFPLLPFRRERDPGQAPLTKRLYRCPSVFPDSGEGLLYYGTGWYYFQGCRLPSPPAVRHPIGGESFRVLMAAGQTRRPPASVFSRSFFLTFFRRADARSEETNTPPILRTAATRKAVRRLNPNPLPLTP